MINLTDIVKQEKNKLSIDSCFLVLLKISTGIENTDPLYLCMNTEDIYWNGNVYQHFPFTIENSKMDSSGSLPSFNITLGNENHALTKYISDSKGLSNAFINLYVVNTNDIDSGIPVFDEYYACGEVTETYHKITIKVGMAYYIRSRRPLYRYLKNHCNWEYKDVRCGYNGDLTSCNHTRTDCIAHNNEKYFGGFPGIDQGGIYK